MTDKPMTQYNEHMYPEPTQMQSMLAQVNEILSRVSRIEKEIKEMRATANLLGQDCLEKSMSILATGAPYEMLPELVR